MAENKEPNIYGTYNPDGSIAKNEDGTKKYPDVDINGASYSLPATTINIDGSRFVVVPTNFNNWEKLEALKTQATPQVVAETPQQPVRNFQRGQVSTESKDGE